MRPQSHWRTPSHSPFILFECRLLAYRSFQNLATIVSSAEAWSTSSTTSGPRTKDPLSPCSECHGRTLAGGVRRRPFHPIEYHFAPCQALAPHLRARLARPARASRLWRLFSPASWPASQPPSPRWFLPSQGTPAETLPIQRRNELRQGLFPRLLIVVSQLTQVLRVQPQLPCHLHMSMRKPEALPCFYPRLHAGRNSRLALCHFDPGASLKVLLEPQTATSWRSALPDPGHMLRLCLPRRVLA